MSHRSVAQFETESRIHLGLVASNLAKSIDFYRVLFGREPTKLRPGYAKFEVAQPPLNLSLTEVDAITGGHHPATHFGIQVKSTDGVQRVAERLREAGVATRAEDDVTCCYAVQSKVWAADPDGNQWEVYVVLSEEGAQLESSQASCCSDPKPYSIRA